MMQKVIYKYEEKEFDVLAAKWIADSIQQKLLQSKTSLNIALSGGSTPLPILHLLKDAPIDWARIAFYMVDERCVSLSDSSCNYSNIHAHFLQYVSSNSFSMLSGALDFAEDALHYEKLLEQNLDKNAEQIPQFDLILLGMGEDGHTASLFPNTAALKEKSSFVFLNKVPQLQTQRITFTYPLIMAAKELLVLCKGSKKEQLVNEIYIKRESAYPIATIAQKHTNIKWLIA